MATTQTGSNTAVVTGDLIVDWNLALISSEQDTGFAWNPSDTMRACQQPGGAAMLAGVITKVGEHISPKSGGPWKVVQPVFDVAAIKPGDQEYHHSYAMWTPFPHRENPDKGEERWVWRVKEFLGLDKARTPDSAGQLQDDLTDPGLVVLDDAGLGFRDREELWPQSIRDADACTPVVIKMSNPVAEGPLWEHLVESCADRLIAVVSVNDLRHREVQISHGLSWERTAQDLFWELVFNPKISALSRCKHVIVSMYTAGALMLTRNEIETDTGAPDISWDCKLFFDPKVIENTWGEQHPGYLIGYTNCLVAGIARALMLSDEVEASVERGIQSGVAAMRKLHMEGYGTQTGYGTQKPDAQVALKEALFPTETIAAQLKSREKPLATVRVENPAHCLQQSPAEDARESSASFWTILDEVCEAKQQSRGECADALEEMARHIVVQDPEDEEEPLEEVPTGRLGELVTADRREIESYRNLRTLIEEYCQQPQTRPLAIGVFGPPGAGKSFGVTQVAKSVTGDDDSCTFNISQFDDPSALTAALHQVRDIALSGKTPLVFWDEFDARLDDQENGWLRYFLAPIQDGEFRDGALTHHIGKAIFVFAGGTSKSMAEFDKGGEHEKFAQAKGPDFVSRLNGYVDIMGPNCQDEERPENDAHHLMRRAIILRSLFERHAKGLFVGGVGKGMLNIDTGVLRAFLEISEYTHGVRSMEAIIKMSTLAGKERFERSCLPTEDQLDLHVDGRKFLSLVQQPEFDDEFLEELAAATHDVYRNITAGYYPSAAAAAMPYAMLPKHLQDQNRANVRHMLVKIDAAGYALVAARGDAAPSDFPGDHLEYLAEMEHERWMLQKLIQGYCYAPEGPDDERPDMTNPNLMPWEELTEEERTERYGDDADKVASAVLPESVKNLDRDLVLAIPKVLAKAGYTLVKLWDTTEDQK